MMFQLVRIGLCSLACAMIIEVNPISYENSNFKPGLNIKQTNAIEGANYNFTVYDLAPLSITTFYFDMRHITNYSKGNVAQFSYPEQWEIAIIMNKTIEDRSAILTTNSYYITLPAAFTQKSTNKIFGYQMSLLAMSQMQVTLQVAVYDQRFYSYTYEFLNTTKIKNEVPLRAIYEEDKGFAVIVQQDDTINLPMNMLPWDTKQVYPEYIISYSTGFSLTQQPQTENKTFYKDESKYWGSTRQVLQNYLPYFSNCIGYGQYLFLTQLTEHEDCNLVPESDTKPVNPYLFGDKPIADYCSVKIQCILDEPINQTTINPRWFELQAQSTIFSMNQDPLSAQEIAHQKYNTQTVVSIETTNGLSQGKMASDISLLIQYYQVTKTQKRIIAGTLAFENFYDLTPEQIANTQQVSYNLTFEFKSLSQPELVNAFALEWQVYFILYLGIATLSTIQASCFLTYHYMMNRKRPRPQLRFVAFLTSIYPDSLYGSLLSMCPIAFIYFLISVIMNGQLYNYQIPYACSWYQKDEQACGIVLFDGFKNDLSYTDPDFEQLRAARSGMACIICGLYLLIVLSNIFVEDYGDEKAKKEVEAYNGNIWYWKLWRKSQLIYTTILVTLFMAMLIQFSFTQLFGINAWYFLIGLKIGQMIIEYVLEEYFQDSMIVSPLSSVMASSINITTMGNDNFYAFLLSYFIDVGTQMLERPYIMVMEEQITEYLEDQVGKGIKVIKKFLDEDDEEDQQDEKLEEDDKKHELNPDVDISDSDILFSDQYEENFASDDESITSQKQFVKQVTSPDVDSSFNEYEQDELEERFKTMYAEQQRKQQSQTLNENVLKTQETASEHEEEDDDKREIIPYFANFSNDMVTLYQQPFIIAAMWILYDQSYWASSYGITKVDFIFYLIWSIVLIPFQIVSDVIFYNLVAQYHGLDFLNYFHKVKERYHLHPLTQGSNDVHALGSNKLDRSLILLDKWCFSSQFYFIMTLTFSATFLILIGTQVIYWNNYNIFADQALIFIVIFWIILCFIVHKSFIWLALRIGLWSLKTGRKVVPQAEGEATQESKKVDESEVEEDEKNNALKVPNWDNVIQLKETEVRLKEISHNLTGDQMVTEQFRRLFITSNGAWMRENIRQVLTPRTLKLKRKQILTSFMNLHGPLDQGDEGEQIEVFEQKKVSQELATKQARPVTPACQAILQYWLQRQRNLKAATSQIGGLMERVTRPYCEFCGLNWGLRTESLDRIEDIHLKFLQEKGMNRMQSGPKIDEWQNYFQKNAKLQTVCLLCSGFMVENVYKDKMEARYKPPPRFTFQQVARAVFYWLIFYRHRML